LAIEQDQGHEEFLLRVLEASPLINNLHGIETKEEDKSR
jgi:hypothetical protein